MLTENLSVAPTVSSSMKLLLNAAPLRYCKEQQFVHSEDQYLVAGFIDIPQQMRRDEQPNATLFRISLMS